MIAKELPWGAFVDDPLLITMRVRGLDLSEATFTYMVQENPFAEPLFTPLAKTPTAGAQGVRVVGVGEDERGLYTDIEILVLQATLAAAVADFPGQGRLTLYHKFQWTLASGGGFSSVDQTVFYGPLSISGGRNA